MHLSSVELRLLPWPGFVLTDLTVDEDPAFGAEPVLHASSVTTAIRLLSLWRGRLEISSISVDEASLNLVRNREGRWISHPCRHPSSALPPDAAISPAPATLRRRRPSAPPSAGKTLEHRIPDHRADGIQRGQNQRAAGHSTVVLPGIDKLDQAAAANSP